MTTLKHSLPRTLQSCLCKLSVIICSRNIHELAGKRVGLFSYGSGLSSTMYSLCISSNTSPDSSLNRLIENLSHIKPLLDQRQRAAPEDFACIMEIREQNHHKGKVIYYFSYKHE
jgi:hydroxymethylglutaryl-CoA synthase